ncbi:MAG: anthranilate synthase component I [Acidimicrobiia bacterium]|nr:anthranilate synthase component I [Acidimicrobiia bacterium]
MTPDLSRAKFIDLAQRYAVVPLSIEVLADRETAVSVFEKLVGDSQGFLLESVEGGERWARWSFVGTRPEFTLEARDSVSSIFPEGRTLAGSDPLRVLEETIASLSVPGADELGYSSDHPPLHSGAVGFLSYDAVRHIEHLPDRPHDDRGLPEMAWQFFGLLAAVDRFRETVHLIRNVFIGDQDPGAMYDSAVNDLNEAAARLVSSSDYPAMARPAFHSRPPARANMTQEEFEAAVLTAKEHIKMGDAFQIVPSLRLEVDLEADPFLVYRALRLVNPSPFMFFVRMQSVSIVGSSPELMVRARNGIATSRPIAGTRPRGATPGEDQRLENELLADPKERAEHVMLIDLARNDLGRVCEFGSVHVDDLMVIERYSHVMHIVSGVSGRLRPEVGPIDVLRATFPHGTVSGAPKVRAMEIIDNLEPTARGPYAGAVGYIDFSGNLDTAIALRTMVAADGKAWVQAGAGVVADSDPTAEYHECMNKAAAVLAAVEAAKSV